MLLGASLSESLAYFAIRFLRRPHIQVQLCENHQAATLCVADYVRQNWEQEFDEIPMPSDPLDATQSYYDRVESERAHVVSLAQLKVVAEAALAEKFPLEPLDDQGEESGPAPH